MILLISSDAARRYSDDIIRALAQPPGTDLQFRYDLNHFDPALRVRATTGRLTSTVAMIAYMAANKAAGTVTLASVRMAVIKHCKMVGSSCILTLGVGNYLVPLDDAAIRARLSPHEARLLPSWQGGQHPHGHFAIEVAGTLEAGHVAAAGKEMEAFEKTAAALGQFAPFNSATGIAFFAVSSIVDEAPGAKRWWRRPVPNPRLEHDRFQLKSGSRYNVDVYTYRPAGSMLTGPATKLTIDSDEKAVRFTSSKEMVLDSRYDLNRFSFTTDQLLNAVPAGLRIALAITSGTPPAAEQRCDIILRTRFGGWERKAILRAGLLAAGTAWPAIIGVAYKDQFSLWVALAMCIGPLVAGYAGTFPLLRKAA